MLNPDADEQEERALKEAKRLIAFYEQHRPELEAKGINVDKVLTDARAKLALFEVARVETEKKEEELLQSAANLADSRYDYFKAVSNLLDKMLIEAPDDPRLQQLAELRDKLQKEFPKE